MAHTKAAEVGWKSLIKRHLLTPESGGKNLLLRLNPSGRAEFSERSARGGAGRGPWLMNFDY